MNETPQDIRRLTDAERRAWLPTSKKGRATPRRPRRGYAITEPAAAPSFEDRYRHAYGHAARRKIAREAVRASVRKVRKANNRRFREWYRNQHVASTLAGQIAVLLGEVGTPAQRELMIKEFAPTAREHELTVEELALSIRAQLNAVQD